MRPPAYDDGAVTLLCADCIEAMAEMGEASVDAIVTDPPYGLEFMGKEWDKFRAESPRRPGPAGTATNHMNRSDSFGPWGRRDRPINPNTHYRRNEKCEICGKWRISSNRCQCPEPRWIGRNRNAASIAMIAFQQSVEAWASEALRVLKPGGHLVAFGGTRTHHRLWCAVEDAGFEIRDTLMWLYGSGFPKSLDVSKAIDKAAGAEREVVGKGINYEAKRLHAASHDPDAGPTYLSAPDGPVVTAPTTDAARQWEGWGTALKPAWEPILLARKPLSEANVAANVLAHGTGALNVDGCRIGWQGEADKESGRPKSFSHAHDGFEGKAFKIADRSHRSPIIEQHPAGRWPANVILDEEAAAMLDAQSGQRGGCAPASGPTLTGPSESVARGHFAGVESTPFYPDSGGASRFFYCAKASRRERNGSKHPTVKPLALMRWLCRLVTPPGGTVLDPFAGTGTTLEAARLEGFRAVGFERDGAYCEDAVGRLERKEAVQEI